MSAMRTARQWPAWIDDVLRYGPIAELEPEWRTAIADAIVDVLDLRSGAKDFPQCEKCGSLKTLHCTIVGCGLPRRYRWRLSRWLSERLP
jgi:hypothetical protein